MKYRKKIEFKHCTLYHNGNYCSTVFNDGYESSNWPQTDKTYRDLVSSLGYDNPMDYCFEHEFFRTFLPVNLYIREGYGIAAIAKREKIKESAFLAEERLIYYFQRWFRDPKNNQALDHNWPELADEARKILYEG